VKPDLQHKLDHALQQRPKPEELVKEGILNGMRLHRFVTTSTIDLNLDLQKMKLPLPNASPRRFFLYYLLTTHKYDELVEEQI
jgi:hypothetical protein